MRSPKHQSIVQENEYIQSFFGRDTLSSSRRLHFNFGLRDVDKIELRQLDQEVDFKLL